MVPIKGHREFFRNWLDVKSKSFTFYALPIYTSEDHEVRDFINRNYFRLHKTSGKELCIFNIEIETLIRSRVLDMFRTNLAWQKKSNHDILYSRALEVLEKIPSGNFSQETEIMDKFVDDFSLEYLDLPCILIFTNLPSGEVFKISLDGSEQDIKRTFRRLIDNCKKLDKSDPDRLVHLQKEFHNSNDSGKNIEQIQLMLTISTLLEKVLNLAEKFSR